MFEIYIFSHRPHASARGATSGNGPVAYRSHNPPFWHITRKNSVRSQNVSSCRKVRILCDATKLFNYFSVGFHCEIFWIIFWVKRNLDSCLTEDSVDSVQSLRYAHEPLSTEGLRYAGWFEKWGVRKIKGGSGSLTFFTMALSYRTKKPLDNNNDIALLYVMSLYLQYNPT